ncbi:hypothetical protein NDU88_000772 [Pleurodeles waltl]|uniref:Uncharacterized protein n=1 Tax=Pleurodeles waltl TaxID=8319 RepID=A0AAV7WIJ7_PLEWA|nr:hypothetical protein NDU88_000772 [Pleurodeles waltl]
MVGAVEFAVFLLFAVPMLQMKGNGPLVVQGDMRQKLELERLASRARRTLVYMCTGADLKGYTKKRLITKRWKATTAPSILQWMTEAEEWGLCREEHRGLQRHPIALEWDAILETLKQSKIARRRLRNAASAAGLMSASPSATLLTLLELELPDGGLLIVLASRWLRVDAQGHTVLDLASNRMIHCVL